MEFKMCSLRILHWKLWSESWTLPYAAVSMLSVLKMVRALEDLAPVIAAEIRSIWDFPKKGINFRDVMPLFQKPSLVDELAEAAVRYLNEKHGKIDAIAGLEARGFLFGPLIAIKLGVAFVPIRKAGKLPGALIQASYEKEYGVDTVEMQSDALSRGARVVIVDDLIATGGTLAAAVDLLGKAGAEIVEAFLIVELAELKGRAAIGEKDVYSSLKAYGEIFKKAYGEHNGVAEL